MAFSWPLWAAARLTLHRSCSVCRICVWKWKDEQCTWPFPCPPAETDTVRKILTFLSKTAVLFIENWARICLHICPSGGESVDVTFHYKPCRKCVWMRRDHLQTQHSPCEKWWCRLCLLSPLWWLTCCALWYQCPSTCHKHENTRKQKSIQILNFPTQLSFICTSPTTS